MLHVKHPFFSSCLHFRFLHEFKINQPVIAGSWGLSLSVFVSINLPLQLFLSCHMSHTPLLSFTHTQHLRQMRWTIGQAHNVCTIRHVYSHKVTDRPFLNIRSSNVFLLHFSIITPDSFYFLSLLLLLCYHPISRIRVLRSYL